MRRTSVVIAGLVFVACSSTTSGDGHGGGGAGGSAGRGSGGSAGGGGTGGKGSGGAASDGAVSAAGGQRTGETGGTSGRGGLGGSPVTHGAGGNRAGGSGSGGATSATGGAVAGSGGKGTGTPGTGGVGGKTGSGSGGAAREGGATGSGGAVGGATGSTVAAGDDYVSDVKVAVHPQTNTVLVVTWTQAKSSDKVLLEFSFTGSDVMLSRGTSGTSGAHRDVVLGVPEKTAVTVRIVNKVGSVDYKTKDYQGTTGALPSGLPRAQVAAYDASLASPEPWLLGAVENSPGGCDNPSCYYVSTFWIFIMDRKGRMVWYWADASDNASSAYPRVARDGEYLVIDKGRQGKTGVVKMTLDRQYYQFVSIPNLDDAIDVTADGSVLYDIMGDLSELTKQGTKRTIWSCAKTFPAWEVCYTNTVNWSPADDTVLMSFPEQGTVVQIDRKTGAMVGQYGNEFGSYAFSPSSWKFQYPHSPTITPQGTLLVSSHLPQYPFGTPAGPNHHAFAEFEIDRTGKKLTQKWVYSDGSEWAMFKGYAVRLANGNTLGNYGTGGAIREITPDRKTAFHATFPATPGDGYNNKMVGNTVYVADLYALNGGGPK